jgi:hypothetical protein
VDFAHGYYVVIGGSFLGNPHFRFSNALVYDIITSKPRIAGWSRPNQITA